MRWSGHIAFPAVVLLLGGWLFAQAGDATSAASVKATVKTAAPARGASPSNAKKDGKARPAITVTPEREAAVMTFVQRNHAELADLLGYLKTSRPAEYERAVKEIFRTTERLALVQERDPLQYELEIAAWTAQSRVQLLAAKLKMETSDELLKQLRNGLKTQNEAKLALLKHERQKASDRMNRLDGEIAQFESDSEKVIDKQLKLLTKAAAEGRSTKLGPKNSGKQAKKSIVPPETKPTQ